MKVACMNRHNCIHMHGSIVSSRVWVHSDGKFTILGEWVVSLEIGQRPGRDSWSYETKINKKSRVLGEASWGRSPLRVKDPNLHAVKHDHRR